VRAFAALERRSKRRGTKITVDELVRQTLDERRGGVPSRWVARRGPAALSATTHQLGPGAGLRVYDPASLSGSRPGPRPAVLYVHGGGWVMGSVDGVDPYCRRLAAALDAVVVSVDYRLGPEHPYPAALDDCVAALAWVRTMREALGIDLHRLAVMGDSAGGNLAAALALQDRDAGGAPPLVSQVLVYPAVDLTLSDAWMREHDGLGITYQDCQDLVRHYLGTEVDPRAEPLASPLHAATLAGLPPALVLTGGDDVLREQGRRYAERLAAEGTSARWVDHAWMPHGFFGADRLLRDARLAQAAALAELRTRLSPGAQSLT
jgi:acetyl esterase